MKKCQVSISSVFLATFFDLNFSAKYQASSYALYSTSEVLLGGCRLLNLDPEQAAVEGVDV